MPLLSTPLITTLRGSFLASLCFSFFSILKDKRMTRMLITLIAISQLCFFNGCIDFYTYQNVDFEVVDAETNEPIADAELGISFLRPHDCALIPTLNSPENQTGISDKRGFGKVKNAKSFGTFSTASYSAMKDGYIFKSEFLTGFDVKDKNETIKFKLYKEPWPTLKIIVPNNYQGPVLVDILPDAKNEHSPGKRAFNVKPNHDGLVRIHSSILYDLAMGNLQIGEELDLRFVDENGQQIKSEDDFPADKLFACRYLVRHIDSNKNRTLFAIGTQKDKSEIRSISHLLYKNESTDGSGNAEQNTTAFKDRASSKFEFLEKNSTGPFTSSGEKQ